MPKKIIDLDGLKKFRQEADKKYVIEGEYSPETKVGYADESGALTPYGENSGANDTTPFVFQSTGGSSDVGSKAYLRALRGNSVAFNQLVKNGNFANTDNWNTSNVSFSVSNNVGSYTATQQNVFIYQYIPTISGHKYLIRCDLYAKTQNNYLYITNTTTAVRHSDTSNDTWETLTLIYTATGATQIRVIDNRASNWTEVKFKNIMLIDLTLMFGAGNEPTSVLEFTRLFPLPYYPYNAGTLLSSKTNGIKNVGYNQLSLDRTEGTLNGNDYSKGNKQDFKETEYYLGLADNDYILRTQITNFSISGNSITFTSAGGGYGVALPIRIIAGQTYTLEFECNITGENKFVSWYDENGLFISRTSSSNGNDFIAPDNAYWGVIILGRGVNTYTYTNICFHLTWDGSRTGYEPYESKSYQLPNVELRSAGEVYDELTPDGTLIRRVGIVKLKDLDWYYNSGNLRFNCTSPVEHLKTPSASKVPNAICSKYEIVSLNSSDNTKVQMFLYNGGGNSNYIGVFDASYNSATSFKNHFTDDDYLYFELEEPTEQTDNTFQESQDVDDYGTQEFLYDNTIDIPVPQGNEFFYPVDYKAFIDSLGGREDIEYDASQIVAKGQLSSGDPETLKALITLVEQNHAIEQANIGGALRNMISGVDFNNTKYIDLGSLSWTYNSSIGFYATISDIKLGTDTSGITTTVCTKYQKHNTSAGALSNLEYVCGSTFIGGNSITIKDTSYTSADTFKNAMKGVLLAYEKA